MIVIIGNLNTNSNDSKRESSSNAKKDTNEEKLSLGILQKIIIGVENIDIKNLDFKINQNPFANNNIDSMIIKPKVDLASSKIGGENKPKDELHDEMDKIKKNPLRREFSFNNSDHPSYSINDIKLEKENEGNFLQKSDNIGFDFSFKNDFKRSKDRSNTNIKIDLLNNPNNDCSCPIFEKSNRKYKEDALNTLPPQYSEFIKDSSNQNIMNPNYLPNLKDKNFNRSNRDLNNLDVGKIINSKVYEDDKFNNEKNFNNLQLLTGTIHNSDNFFSMGKIENSIKNNILEKSQIRYSSKSITTINSEFPELNESKKNKIKLTLNSQNTIMTNQSGTNNITNFTVLEHDEIDFKFFNRNDNGDSFSEAFFLAGIVPKKVKMIPNSDDFIPPCKHKNCAILNAYRPEIIECFPGSVIDGIEINATVIIFIFLTLDCKPLLPIWNKNML